jgi:alkylhydroperoxidase family enzyme
MKLLYALTRKKYGKVLTPLKVYGARLPLAFGSFYGKISSLDKKLVLPKETQAMVREMVARINICLFCMDIGRWHATGTLVNVAKLNALPEYATSPLFSEKDRALLDYVCELTRNKQVKPETFSRLASFYPEREICEIVYLVASEHVYNVTNLGLNIHSDMLCELKQRVPG